MKGLSRGLLLSGLLVLLLSGCSQPSESTRYRLSGAVTLDGQPIPSGQITFTPDGSQKNTGPEGLAEIRDGKFDTSTGPLGKGIAGGPTVIHVVGFSAPGKLLCDYKLQVDLPRSDGTYDIKLPKEATAKPTSAREL
jgi:hypothetical protein